MTALNYFEFIAAYFILEAAWTYCRSRNARIQCKYCAGGKVDPECPFPRTCPTCNGKGFQTQKEKQ